MVRFILFFGKYRGFLRGWLFSKAFNFNGVVRFLGGPLKIRGNGCVNIGRNVRIGSGVWLNFSGSGENVITIGDNVYIGDDCQINCAGSVKIRDEALIANRVFIGNVDHNVEGDSSLPIKKRGELYLGDIVIGEGAFLGINSVILGCSVGKNAVVGALSFINKDVGDDEVGLTTALKGTKDDI